MPLEDLKTTVHLRHPRKIDELKQFYSTSGYRNILWRLLLLKAIIHNSIIKSVFTFQSYNILKGWRGIQVKQHWWSLCGVVCGVKACLFHSSDEIKETWPTVMPQGCNLFTCLCLLRKKNCRRWWSTFHLRFTKETTAVPRGKLLLLASKPQILLLRNHPVMVKLFIQSYYFLPAFNLPLPFSKPCHCYEWVMPHS